MTQEIRELESTFGLYPNFFKSSKNPAVNEMMWNMAKSAYIDLPIPSLFKEKIFVYLSKYCPEKYCLSRHSGFVLGFGSPAGDKLSETLDLEELIELLSLSNTPDDLASAQVHLSNKIKLKNWDDIDQETENNIIRLLPKIFLTPRESAPLSSVLSNFLGEDRFDLLIILLNFIRSAHYWTQTRGSLLVENDISKLLAENERLALLINQMPDLTSLSFAAELETEYEKLKTEKIKTESLEKLNSELTKTKNSLEQTSKKWIKALENSETGVWELDLQKNTAWRSQKHDQIFGYEELLPEWNFDIFLKHVVEADRSEVLKKFNYAMENNKDWSFVCRILNAKGREQWIQARGEIEINPITKEKVRFFGTVRDITVQQKLKTNLLLEKENAINENNLKSEFLRNISHEIRTPMNSILSYSQMLKDPSFSENQKQDFVNNINFSGKHLMSLIDDVLSYSRAEAGHEVSFVNIKLRPILKKIVGSLRPLALGTNTEINLKIPAGKVLVTSSSPTFLRQIIFNLVNNAIKFTKNGRVEISLGKSTNKKEIEVRVADTGIGMSREFQQKLFRPFSQEDNSSTRKYNGMGIGLALSKKLSKDLNGDLRLEKSDVGKGTTFLLSLPLVSEKIFHQTTEKDESKTDYTLENISILVAEDSVENYRILEIHLASESVKLDWVKNGKEAVEKCNQNEYDIILMDIQMPVMDGYTATRQIKSQKPDLPIIALTAHALPQEFQFSMDAGCDDHLTKPIDKNELVEAIYFLSK